MVNRFDLLKIPIIKRILKSRVFQPLLMMIFLAFFFFSILTGFFGTPAGSRNFSIIYIWIVWWALLMVVLVPLFGRAWCMVCPIPGPAEWLQRRAIVQRIMKPLRTLNLRWPKKLKNIWLQNLSFLGIALFSIIILTRPSVTAFVLLSMVVIAIILSFLFKDRVFCRYVCPVGGFIGLYSLASGLELRVKDQNVCLNHKTKDCIIGNSCGYGCPWMVYPGKLERNSACGLCTECIKTCTEDNIALNLRPLGADLLVVKGRGMDEAFKSLIMLTCALVYSGVMMGPWGWIKQWANMDTYGHWLGYALGFLFLNLVLVPSVFYMTVYLTKYLSKTKLSVKYLFREYAYVFVPLGLAGWMAFSLGFIFVNGTYALVTLSDPLGWGWNLWGTSSLDWTPIFTGFMPILQTIILNIGLFFSVGLVYKIGKQQLFNHDQAIRAAIPVSVLLFFFSAAFSYLFLG